MLKLLLRPEPGLPWDEAAEAIHRLDRATLEREGVEPAEAMELMDHFGQTTRVRFVNIVRNPRIEAEEFRFTPPAGADVLGEK